jgi:hypothetical protein
MDPGRPRGLGWDWEGGTEDLSSHHLLTLSRLTHLVQREAALCQAIDSLGSGAS